MRRRPGTGTTSAPTGPEFTGQGPGDGRQVPLESSPEMGSDMSSAYRGPCLWDIFVWQHWRGRRRAPVFARTTRRLSPCAARHPRPPADIKVPCSRSRTSRTNVRCLLGRLRAYQSTCPQGYRLGWPDQPSATWCRRYKGRRTRASCHPPSSPSIGDWPRGASRRGANPILVPPRWPSCVSQRALASNVLWWGSGASATRSGCKYPKQPPLRQETCDEPAWPPSLLRKWGAHRKRSVLWAAGQLVGLLISWLWWASRRIRHSRSRNGERWDWRSPLLTCCGTRGGAHCGGAFCRGGGPACYHPGPHLRCLSFCLRVCLERKSQGVSWGLSRFGKHNKDALMPDCGVHYLGPGGVFGVILSHFGSCPGIGSGIGRCLRRSASYLWNLWALTLPPNFRGRATLHSLFGHKPTLGTPFGHGPTNTQPLGTDRSRAHSLGIDTRGSTR